jgi:hypothetical protein
MKSGVTIVWAKHVVRRLKGEGDRETSGREKSVTSSEPRSCCNVSVEETWHQEGVAYRIMVLNKCDCIPWMM